MNLPLSLVVGLRYVRSPRDFLSSVASLAVLGLALSIGILLVVQAVQSGFEQEFRDRILGVMPHVTVYAREGSLDESFISEQLSKFEEVHGHSTQLEGRALLVVPISGRTLDSSAVSEESSLRPTSAMGRSEPIQLEGIDPNADYYSPKLLSLIDPADLRQFEEDQWSILLGASTARRLGVQKGDRVTLMVHNEQLSPLGYLPRQKQTTIAGVVDTETFLDRNRAYIHIESARKFFSAGQSRLGYRIRLDDPFGTTAFERKLNRTLNDPNFLLVSWRRGYGERIYAAIMMSRYSLMLIFSLLVAVAAFNLVSTVAVMVSERRRDVAVLRTLGSSRTRISLSFLNAGIAISGIGMALGIVLGYVIGWALELGLPWVERLFNLDLLSQYFVHSLNVKFRISDLLSVIGIGFGLCILAVLVPALRSAQMNPAVVLRHD